MLSQVYKIAYLLVILINLPAYSDSLLKRGSLHKFERLHFWEWSIKAINSDKALKKLDEQEFPTLSRVEVYRLTFATVNQKDEPILSTGLVLFPIEIEHEPLPFLSYQHATRMHARDAPSALMFDPEASANAILYASRCCIVTMSDYLGLDKLNDSAQFYMNAEIQARVAYDLISASKKLLAFKNRRFRKEVLIAGYSQGAHNALGLHKYIQENHSHEMKVLGTSVMSGPYGISHMARQVFNEELKIKINPVFLGLAIYGMHEAYEDFPRLTEILQPEPAAALPGLMKEGNFSAINKALPKDMSELFQISNVLEIIDEGDEHPFWNALLRNDVDNFKPNAPVLMIHSSTDDVIPFSTAKASSERLAALGANIEFVELVETNSDLLFVEDGKAKLDHIEAAYPAFLRTARFFNEILKTLP